MARQFVAANSEHLLTGLPVSVAPFTISLWFYHSNDAAGQSIWTLASTVSSTSYWQLVDRTGGHLRFTARAGGATHLTTSTNPAVVDTWNHACGVERASDNRSLYLNGGNKVDNTTGIAPAPTRMGLGCRANDTIDEFLDGRIAEIGIWNVGLTEFDVKRLAQGYSPPLVRPEYLVWYKSLRTENYNYDSILPTHIQQPANLLTNVGSTFTGHPPNIIYPLGHLRIPILAPQAVAGVTMPKFYHHYQRNTG